MERTPRSPASRGPLPSEGTLQRFVAAVADTVSRDLAEPQLLGEVKTAMAALVAADGWLPEALARPHPELYQQYLLHLDSERRFCVVSFVWGPGQQTPIHDHTVWGVIGMLRGSETSQGYRRTSHGLVAEGDAQRLSPGEVTAVSPSIGDIHRVGNAHGDRVSISIHAYGTDIGRRPRHVFDPLTGATKSFVSGYAATRDLAT
jgi:predicted metal-dependent enzyme (double-stranded beta helix superfamily)